MVRLGIVALGSREPVGQGDEASEPVGRLMVAEDGVRCSAPLREPPFDGVGAPLGVGTVWPVVARAVRGVAVAVALAGPLPQLAEVVEGARDEQCLERLHQPVTVWS